MYVHYTSYQLIRYGHYICFECGLIDWVTTSPVPGKDVV